jgi:hypothetical protein
LDGELIPEARDGFLVVKRWVDKALNTGARQPPNQRVQLAATRLTISFEDKWEEAHHLEHLKSALTTATGIFGLLLDPLD